MVTFSPASTVPPSFTIMVTESEVEGQEPEPSTVQINTTVPVSRLDSVALRSDILKRSPFALTNSQDPVPFCVSLASSWVVLLHRNWSGPAYAASGFSSTFTSKLQETVFPAASL